MSVTLPVSRTSRNLRRFADTSSAGNLPVRPSATRPTLPRGTFIASRTLVSRASDPGAKWTSQYVVSASEVTVADQLIGPHGLFAPIGKPVYQEFAGRDSLARLRDSAVDAVELGIELPRRIDRLLGEIERGNLLVWTRVEDVEPQMKRLEHLGERLNATMLAATCIVTLGNRHAVLPSARMGSMDRRGVLDCGCGGSTWLRQDLVGLAQVSR